MRICSKYIDSIHLVASLSPEMDPATAMTRKF